MAEQVIAPRLAMVARQVAKLLKDRKETICVVETAGGGLVSAALLATPGASVSILLSNVASQMSLPIPRESTKAA